MTKIALAPARLARQGAPEILLPSILGASPRKMICCRIPTLGQRPITFAADALPDGLCLAPEGILTGCVEQAGEYRILLTAQNQLGAAEKTVVLRVAPDTARLTPLMGWTSWNACGKEVSQEKIEDAIDRFDQIGLADFGYQYINIDSGWQGEYGGAHDAVMPNGKFPDMAALTRNAHEKGLKIGIYSTPMQKAWGGGEYPGCTRGQLDLKYADTYFGVGKEHLERQNVAQWTEWGFDYLKYDWAPCDVENAARMKQCLVDSERDYAYSVTVRAGMADADWWKSNCSSWRDNVDSDSVWPNLRQRFDADAWAAHTCPGHYFDQDMLETGVTVWHENRLTQDEQLIAYSIRALFPSPIQISCDLRKLTDFDRAMLMNEEVIAINQDALSEGAVCLKEYRTRTPAGEIDCEIKVYGRHLEDGGYALGLFNLGNTEETLALPLSESVKVRDLWAKQDVQMEDQQWRVALPSHTVRLLRVTKV